MYLLVALAVGCPYLVVQCMWIFPAGGRGVISGETDTAALNII
jgi:hypothetical protein